MVGYALLLKNLDRDTYKGPFRVWKKKKFAKTMLHTMTLFNANEFNIQKVKALNIFESTGPFCVNAQNIEIIIKKTFWEFLSEYI